MKRKSRNNHAFTILEVAVVASVIGMLASLAMPLWSKSTATAHHNFCIHNQRKIYEAVSLYELENATVLSAIKNNGVAVRNTLVNAGYVKGGYLNVQSYFDCPTSRVFDNDDYRLTYNGTALTGTRCDVLSSHVAQ